MSKQRRREPTDAARAAGVADVLAAQLDRGELTAVVGANLRRRRTQRGLSLVRLATRSGVSRTMISQIELGQSSPTINVLARLTRALGLTFSALVGARTGNGPAVLRAATASYATSGALRRRRLCPDDAGRPAELYELRLGRDGAADGELGAPTTLYTLTVASGSVELAVDGTSYSLSAGDSVLLEADRPHAYRNAGPDEALLYLLVSKRMVGFGAKEDHDGQESRRSDHRPARFGASRSARGGGDGAGRGR